MLAPLDFHKFRPFDPLTPFFVFLAASFCFGSQKNSSTGFLLESQRVKQISLLMHIDALDLAVKISNILEINREI